jgi:hypothetical protein
MVDFIIEIMIIRIVVVRYIYLRTSFPVKLMEYYYSPI